LQFYQRRAFSNATAHHVTVLPETVTAPSQLVTKPAQMLNARHSVVHPEHASRNVTTVTWSAQATLVIVNSGVFPEHAHSSAMPDAAYNYAMMESVLARRQAMTNGFCRDIVWSCLLYFSQRLPFYRAYFLYCFVAKGIVVGDLTPTSN